MATINILVVFIDSAEANGMKLGIPSPYPSETKNGGKITAGTNHAVTAFSMLIAIQ
jgi:hypothetical protein